MILRLLLVVWMSGWVCSLSALAQTTKRIHESFPLHAHGTVTLNGKYGNLHIESWDSDQVEIDVNMEVEGKDPYHVAYLLDHLEISFDHQADRLVMQADLPSIKAWRTSLEGTETVEEIEFAKGGPTVKVSKLDISYHIKVPRNSHLKTDFKYAHLFLESLDGTSDLRVSFGQIQARNLPEEAYVFLRHAKGMFSQVADADIVAAYSDLTVRRAGSINLQSDHSDVRIDNALNLTSESHYNDMALGSIAKASLIEHNSHVEIRELGNTGAFDMMYGDLMVQQVGAEFSSLKLNGTYSDMELTIDQEASYALDLSAEDSEVRVPNDMKIAQMDDKAGIQSLQGTVGQGGTARVEISSKRGNLVLN
ncbi:DUF4097 family beta strand repeat-containing protein [Pontibacter sp. G13]|uniref:DUF4097 family beta strand repeat-containing protein n=1 Tax=Pontibacter sp. G13 TaxID=3074898 RepID=UPI00288BF601|nr:DUF4097 family beta strand repeat-containing protein [Pontibacter sp. G13]WNJ20657.1 DUF4097 family beta strand repeat-containing protein [Pontibacter sp. G13]